MRWADRIKPRPNIEEGRKDAADRGNHVQVWLKEGDYDASEARKGKAERNKKRSRYEDFFVWGHPVKFDAEDLIGTKGTHHLAVGNFGE